VVRNRSDEDRAAFIKPFQDALKTEEGHKPLEMDADRRRKIFSMVISQVKGLGDGSDKGDYSWLIQTVTMLIGLQKLRASLTCCTHISLHFILPTHRKQHDT
jgi:hypothetical protein